jgi:hypothetical protein
VIRSQKISRAANAAGVRENSLEELKPAEIPLRSQPTESHTRNFNKNITPLI